MIKVAFYNDFTQELIFSMCRFYNIIETCCVLDGEIKKGTSLEVENSLCKLAENQPTLFKNEKKL